MGIVSSWALRVRARPAAGEDRAGVVAEAGVAASTDQAELGSSGGDLAGDADERRVGAERPQQALALEEAQRRGRADAVEVEEEPAAELLLAELAGEGICAEHAGLLAPGEEADDPGVTKGSCVQARCEGRHRRDAGGVVVCARHVDPAQLALQHQGKAGTEDCMGNTEELPSSGNAAQDRRPR